MTGEGAERSGVAVAHAVLDGNGRLLSADPVLDRLNWRAGGDVGQPLAVPALATVVRLARRLGIMVSRRALAADEKGDVEMWARAQPDGKGVRLAVSGWQRRPGWRGVAGAGGLPGAANDPDGKWRWDTDAALRLIQVSTGAGRRQVRRDRVAGTAGHHPVHAGRGEWPVAAGRGGRQARAADGGWRKAARQWQARDPVGDRPARYGGTVRRLHRRRPSGPAGIATAPRPPSPALADEFITGLDRSLRRPLAQIIANADSIHNGTEGDLGSVYTEYAANIAHAGRHLLSLVDDLVDLQAVERPDFAPVSDAIDLAAVARRAAGLLTVRAGGAGVVTKRPLPGATLWARGDFKRALQILVNLIGNAIRYAPYGSIVLFGLHRGAGQVAISMADGGKGIAPAAHGKVFEKLERIDSSEPGGNRLGLYIARRFAQAMGGDLTLASAPGEGARFTLSLPAEPSRREDQHQP